MAPLSSETDRITRWFMAAVTLYFTAHALLRTALGGSFEMDEAEMLLLAQEWRLGYGPQLPLYNWWQALWFTLFGVNSFALAGAKNMAIGATYLFLYFGLLRVYPARLALAGALSLMLVPNFVWEAQRANTHSTAMCLMMAVFIWAFAGVLTRARGRDYVALGLALGLGAISKYNFFLYAVPLILAGLLDRRYRPALLRRQMLGVLTLAAALSAVPYLWLLQNSAQSMTSVDKFYKGGAAQDLPPWLGAAAQFMGALLTGLLIAALAALLLRGWRQWLRGDGRRFSRLLARAFGLSCLLGLAGAMAAQVTTLQLRWLLPQFLLGAPLLLIWGSQRLRYQRALYVSVGLLGLAALAAMADIRLRGAGSDSLRVDLLAQELARKIDRPPLVISDYYYAGNLRFHRPDWAYARRFDPALAQRYPGPVLLLATHKKGKDTLARHRARLPKMQLQAQGVLAVPHRFAPDQTRMVRYLILTPPDP